MIGRDSLRDIDACFLCLKKLNDPVSCTKGHVACKECFYENILAQKKNIARMMKLYETQKQMLEEENEKKKLEKIEKEVEQFEAAHSAVKGVKRSADGDVKPVVASDPKKLNSFWIVSLIFVICFIFFVAFISSGNYKRNVTRTEFADNVSARRRPPC